MIEIENEDIGCSAVYAGDALGALCVGALPDHGDVMFAVQLLVPSRGCAVAVVTDFRLKSVNGLTF